MPNPIKYLPQILNATCRGAQAIENVARFRSWRWLRNTIEVTVTSYRLINPFGIMTPFIQPLFDFVDRNEPMLGLVLAVLTIAIMVGEHRSLSALLARAKSMSS